MSKKVFRNDRATASCLYEGVLGHHRAEPDRAFSHPFALFYLDLDELGTLLDGRFVDPRPGLNRYRRADYHGDPAVSLAEAVRATVTESNGVTPTGPIRMLTNLRSFGHCFNPVSFYYCFAADGTTLEAVMAEVTNTPWGERHSYVIGPDDGAELDKAMHVSPFFGMSQRYRWSAPAPADELRVVIENYERERKVFEASLLMRRRELDDTTLRRFNFRYPAATLRVLALIYGHALGVRLAGVRVVPHP